MALETSYGIATNTIEFSDMLGAELHYRTIVDPADAARYWQTVRVFFRSIGIDGADLLELEWKTQVAADNFEQELMTMGAI